MEQIEHMTDEELIKKFQIVEDNFNQALISNNVAEISNYISSDWVLLESQFGIITKTGFYKLLKKVTYLTQQ